MRKAKRFMKGPDFWIDTLEQVYGNWARKVKAIEKKYNNIEDDLKDLTSIENTILVIETKLRDMGVEGFKYSAIECQEKST